MRGQQAPAAKRGQRAPTAEHGVGELRRLVAAEGRGWTEHGLGRGHGRCECEIHYWRGGVGPWLARYPRGRELERGPGRGGAMAGHTVLPVEEPWLALLASTEEALTEGSVRMVEDQS